MREKKNLRISIVRTITKKNGARQNYVDCTLVLLYFGTCSSNSQYFFYPPFVSIIKTTE